MFLYGGYEIKKGIIVLTIGLTSLLLVSCSSNKSKPDKLKGLEFTVVEDADVPEKLMGRLMKRKVNHLKQHIQTKSIFILRLDTEKNPQEVIVYP